MSTQHRNIGAFFDTGKGNIKPQNQAGAQAVNGTGVDRTGHLSAKINAQSGTATGAPTGQAHTVKLQESYDNVTYTDVTGASITLDADDANKELDVDLSARKQYVRLVLTTSFTGGTSPANDFSAVMCIGGSDVIPASV